MAENKLNVIVPKDYNGTPIQVVLREGKSFKRNRSQRTGDCGYWRNDRSSTKMAGKAY